MRSFEAVTPFLHRYVSSALPSLCSGYVACKPGLGRLQLWTQNRIGSDQLSILVVPNLGFGVAQSQHH